MEVKEDIVIAGVAGRFPNCTNMDELMDALFAGTDLITEGTRFPLGKMGIPTRMGQVPDLDKFDASFFGITPKHADFTDPRVRILCETTYECIIDAGFNPRELRGTNTGVYTGITAFKVHESLLEREDTEGYTSVGFGLHETANRISYCFDFKGNSYAMDTACSSSLHAFCNAVEDIRSDKVDGAVVSGVNIIFHPKETRELQNMTVLARDGKCKTFSTIRDGFVRSEAVVSLLLLKKSACRRMYATVVGVGSNNDGSKQRGITFPSADMQLSLMKNIYFNNGINNNDVTYMEAHGTGTKVGDVQELNALAKMFCDDRKNPLLMGAVKSNIGHTEAAAGLCSIIKVITAMETGTIPSNLHAIPLDVTLPGIKDEKIKVVTKNSTWEGGLAAINAFGFGGTNSHVVLRSNATKKSRNCSHRKHRLVLVSGRTEDAVNNFLDGVINNKNDEEFLALIDDIHKIKVDGHMYRGYAILSEATEKEILRCADADGRPIWFIYGGFGAQWVEVGRDLINNEIFRNFIKQCAEILEPYDVNLEEIFTSDKIEVNKTYSYCTVNAAVQMGITEVLYSLNLAPDGIVGYSLGEIACAYADDQLTLEQAILLAYAHDYAFSRAKLVTGLMAVVGISKEECLKSLPVDVRIACVNGNESVTVTGPKESVLLFLDQISSQGVSVDEINSGGFAYHSKYVEDAVPYFIDFVKNVVTPSKLATSKWVPSSVKAFADFSCGEYYSDRFRNVALFESRRHLPANAVVIEISAHEDILKTQLDPNVTVLNLADRDRNDNELCLLSTIGKTYLAGAQPNLKKLYKGVTYPVSRGTKMISPLVKWDHRHSWMVPIWKHKDYFGHKIVVNLSNPKYAYLKGHNIDGTVLMPASGYMELAWRTLAYMRLEETEKLSVVMEDIKFIRSTTLLLNVDVEFLIVITKQSGYFEISEGGSIVCTGTIYTAKDVSGAYYNANQPNVSDGDNVMLTSKEVYKEMRLKRYLYEGYFQGIKECDVQVRFGKVKWQENFCAFLDTMIQLTIIDRTTRNLFLPIRIERLVIDPQKHKQLVTEEKDVSIFFNQNVNVIKAGAIEVNGVQLYSTPIRRKIENNLLLETYKFLRYENFEKLSFDDSAILVALQIIVQNHKGVIKNLTICEFVENDFNELKKILKRQVMVETKFIKFIENYENIAFDVMVITDSLMKRIDTKTIIENLSENGMVLYQGNITNIIDGLTIIYQTQNLYLLRPTHKIPSNYFVIPVKNYDLQWLQDVKNLTKGCHDDTVYLVSQNEETSGIVGLVKCLLTEPTSLKFKCVFIQDENAPVFSLENEFYRNQLAKNLNFNVLRNGQWGTFVHLPFQPVKNKQVANASVSILTSGNFSTLQWVEKPFKINSEQVYVYYASLNFNDVLIANDNRSKNETSEPTFSWEKVGSEYAGITSAGQRLMGIVEDEGLSLQVERRSALTWVVPDNWSLKEAATIPFAYSIGYLALIVKGKMRRGETILIHQGSGGIGSAAITIALSMGCTVFTTVGSQIKRDFLIETYPELNEDNIGYSRSKSFQKMVLENTNGKGVNLVLNSVSGELFHESLNCLARNGRFLDIGHGNLSATPKQSLNNNYSFHRIDVNKLLENDINIIREIHDAVDKGIRNGTVKPLETTLFKDNEIEKAFKFLASGQHKGKVLVEVRQEDSITNNLVIRINAVPKICFDREKSYIIIGGLGGVGLELADWMIKRGATKLILNSRRKIHNGYQAYCLKRWSKWNAVNVEVNTDDTSTLDGAQNLVAYAKNFGPVGGIFFTALVLDNALINNQTRDKFEQVFRPKIKCGENMDVITRMECPELDYFVVCSSLAAGRGTVGQSNYGMANSAFESLCEKRRAENLPALVVQWGSIGDVGYVVENELYEKVKRLTGVQSISSCLDVLEKFMLNDKVVIGSSLVSVNNTNHVEDTKREDSPAEAVAHLLGIRNMDVIDKASTLLQIGLDSLLVAEIKQTLHKNYNINLSNNEIREMTFERLIKMASTETDTFTKNKF